MEKKYINTKSFIKSGIAIFSLGLILTVGSCTDLKEEVFSEVTKASFVPAQDDIVALMASGYTPLRYIMDWQGLFDVQEEPGDVIVTPTRPQRVGRWWYL